MLYVLFVNIIDKVFIMPNIEHTSDSSIPSVLDNNFKTPSTFFSNEDFRKNGSKSGEKIKNEFTEVITGEIQVRNQTVI